MKVKRHKIGESYNTTVDWLNDYLNSKFYKKEKFNTIEDKMADLKNRVGFDKVTTNANDLPVKSASGCPNKNQKGHSPSSCKACGGGKLADDSNIQLINNLKDYILSIIEDSNITMRTPSSIMDMCSKNTSISPILSKINQPLLIEFISHNLDKGRGNKSNDLSSLEYIPLEDMHDLNSEDDKNLPEYMNYSKDL